MPKKQRTKKQIARRAPPTTITAPSEIYPASRERDWFNLQFKQLRDRVDRLETSSIGEFAALLDSLRQQLHSLEINELARVAEINRFGRSAADAAKSRVDDVVNTASAEFVTRTYLHTWVARINQQLDELRALIAPPPPAA